MINIDTPQHCISEFVLSLVISNIKAMAMLMANILENKTFSTHTA